MRDAGADAQSAPAAFAGLPNVTLQDPVPPHRLSADS
jgi:hypothetical protein